jgi:nitroimidazol reductase NimA-like FMN-containing flavoprotein (pyridoxamine 5'-phosphate oxidase superfamily)
MTDMTIMREPIAEREPAGEIDPRFSEPEAEATPWAEARSVLQDAMTYWFTTVRGDGRPHVTTIAAVWVEDAIYMTTGDGEQKQHNLRSNPRVALTTGCNGFSGLDVVVEAEAVEVTDGARLQAVADAFIAKYGDVFRFNVDEHHLRLPESPDGIVRCYRLAARKGFGFAKGDPFSQTRWRFAND